MNDGLRCPTCRAAWREVAICPRCGTDLTSLMRVAVRAWQLREAARRALLERADAGAALAAARAAVRLHGTESGRRLLVLALLSSGHGADALALARAMGAFPTHDPTDPDPGDPSDAAEA